MAEQKGNIMLAVALGIIFVVVICIAGYFLIARYVNDYNQSLSQDNQQQTTQADETANWNLVKNDSIGFQFKYPTDFGSKYASFQSSPVVAITTDASKIDSKGCLPVNAGGPANDSQVTINNIPFCLSVSGDPGAGQLYNSYYYTTSKNGNYYTIEYVVHTLNGCSPYMNTPDYQPCTDFMNNYNTLVVKPIQTSVGTFTFTK